MVLIEDQNFESLKNGTWAVVSRMVSKLSKIHQSKSQNQCCVWEPKISPRRQQHFKAGGRKVVKKAMPTPQKASMQNSLFAIQHPSRTHLRSVARQDETQRLHDSGQECKTETSFHRIIFYGYDERVGGHEKAAQERRLAHPEGPGTLRLRCTLPEPTTGYSSVQAQRALGNMTGFRPTSRTVKPFQAPPGHPHTEKG